MIHFNNVRMDLERAKFGAAKLSQIMPRCCKLRSHFSGCHFSPLCMRASIVPAEFALQVSNKRSLQGQAMEGPFCRLVEAAPVSLRPSRNTQGLTSTNQTPIGNSTNHSRSLLVVPQSGNLVPNFPVAFQKLHQNLLASTLAVPNFAPPPPLAPAVDYRRRGRTQAPPWSMLHTVEQSLAGHPTGSSDVL